MRRVSCFSSSNQMTWERSVQLGTGLLIGYLLAADPTEEASALIARDVAEAGIDVLELGIPSRRPHLDGDIIRRGHVRARERLGGDEERLLACLRQIRSNVDIPIWAMGYRSELIDSGLWQRLAAQGLIDGLVLPDCDLAEQTTLQRQVADAGVDVVRFVHNGMPDEELEAACESATILYAQSYHGATGDPFAQLQSLSTLGARMARYPDVLKVAGFGLRSPQRVREAIDSGFDGAVVGSALVARWEYGERDSLFRLVAEMKEQTVRTVDRGDLQ